MDNCKKRITIVGGGPAGALQACYLAKHGYKVDLFEARNDIRKQELAVGKSINLALSHRGIEALRNAGCHEKIISLGVPMHGRMIHKKNGETYSIPYGKKGQYLLSIDRFKLNQDLLDEADSFANVKCHFNQKLKSCDFDNCVSTFENTEDKILTEHSSDLVVGCDGAFSAVRRQMQRGKFDYKQSFFDHGYKELTIYPNNNGDAKLALNYLHIWPINKFMMIALPNQDNSFTCTLFLPIDIFNTLTDGDKVMTFFNDIFPSSIKFLGESYIRKAFFDLPPQNIVSIKCSPYHRGSTGVILGDAAHACVPFYGQGLNCSLEDVLVFSSVMEEHNGDFKRVLPAFTATRCKDGHAVSKLSVQNYLEMRSSVNSSWFLFRKKVDNILNYFFPSIFVPKYSMVAFTRIRYSEVIKKSKQQDKLVNIGLFVLGLLLATSAGTMIWKYQNGKLVAPPSLSILFEKVQQNLSIHF